MTPDPAPYVRDLSWRYPQKIKPMRTPYPWKRVGFAMAFTALCLVGSVIVVAL